MEASIR